MYIHYALAKATQDDMLRAAAREQLCSQARAARRARTRRNRGHRLPNLPVLNGRRAAQAH